MTKDNIRTVLHVEDERYSDTKVSYNPNSGSFLLVDTGDNQAILLCKETLAQLQVFASTCLTGATE